LANSLGSILWAILWGYSWQVRGRIGLKGVIEGRSYKKEGKLEGGSSF